MSFLSSTKQEAPVLAVAAGGGPDRGVKDLRLDALSGMGSGLSRRMARVVYSAS